MDVDQQERALLDAVLADPESDDARRRIASWFDARNDPRGEFIRLQLDAARSDVAAERRRADRAAEALLAKHRQAWMPSFGPYVAYTKFLRGFVELIQIESAQFLQHAVNLYARAPIRMLVLTDSKPDIRELAASPHLARIVKLSISSAGLTDADLIALVESPHLGKLKALDVSFNQIGLKGLDALAASTRVPNLLAVNFVGNLVDSPVEDFAQDWMTGGIDSAGGFRLPDIGKQLEAKYGGKPWLHAPSQLRQYPPDDEDL